MSFNIKSISVFERQAKRLVKKFPSLKIEIQELIKELKEEPEKGTSIGNNCNKIRLGIASKGKGKSGGARVIVHVVFKDGIVYLLSIYDKSELENLTDNEILELIKLIPR
jgi:mRNA-degrading endonuclease RelE of RelBE toxin-antitoxin system